MIQDAIILVLSCLGLAQAIFLCIYLFTLKKGNRQANLFLAFVLLGLTIRIGKSILNVYLDLEPWQRNLGLSGVLMVGPFLWFYGRLLFRKPKVFSFHNYWHLLPFILFVCFCKFIPNGSGQFPTLGYWAVFLHLMAYLILGITYWSIINQKPRNQFGPGIGIW